MAVALSFDSPSPSKNVLHKRCCKIGAIDLAEQATQLKQQLNQAIQLAEQQLIAAKKNQWDEVAVLEQQRQAVIGQCFTSDIPEPLAKLAKLGVEKLQQQEAELMVLAEKSHQQASQLIKQRNRGNQATDAYQKQR